MDSEQKSRAAAGMFLSGGAGINQFSWELQLALSCIGGAGITHFPIVSDTQTVRVWPCLAVGFN